MRDECFPVSTMMQLPPDEGPPEKNHIRAVRIGDGWYHVFGDLVIGFIGRCGYCIDARRSKSPSAL